MTKKANERAADDVLVAPRWTGWRALELVYQMNERCLEYLSRAVVSGEHIPVEALRRYGEWWRSLDDAARERAARVSFLLIDVHFNDVVWWQQVREVIRNAVATEDAAADSLGAQLVAETLVNVWQACQTDVRQACLTIGMAPAVAAMVAGFSQKEIRAVAAIHYKEMWLRLKHDPAAWKRMLIAAVTGNKSVLADVHLHAELLVCGELIAAGEPVDTAPRHPK